MSEKKMSPSETYNLLAAVSSFRAAYDELVDTYNKIEEADLSKEYPLSPMDLFDANTRAAIKAWLNANIVDLINSLPDRVVNPECIKSCLEVRSEKRKRPAFMYNGDCCNRSFCVGDGQCGRCPTVMFDPKGIEAYLKAQTFDKKLKAILDPDKKYSDAELRIMYETHLRNLEFK
jgi:hypothetical protein